MKFTQIPSDTFSKLQLNAGIVLDGFTPATGVIGNILGATSGGVSFVAQPSFSDMGENLDNTPNNTKELKKLDYYEVAMSGTFKTVSASLAKKLVSASDIDALDTTHIIPRHDLESADFDDIWWVGDYSDNNGNTNGGFIAIHLMNALNTDGFQIQSNDDGEGDFAFNFMGHYSIDEPDTVPFEIFVKAGTPASVTLSNSTLSLTVGGSSSTLTATTVPADAVVTWASDKESVATVTSGGVVAPVAEGTANITASITVDGKTKTATCVATVTQGA